MAARFLIRSAPQIACDPESIPADAGVYALLVRDGEAWMRRFGLFHCEPRRGAMPTLGGIPVCYVGLAGSRGLRARLADHLLGTGYASTLRRSLGCLLHAELQLSVRHQPHATYFHFGEDGEPRLNAWLAAHALFAFKCSDDPEAEERRLRQRYCPPLNLKEQQDRPFARFVQELRAAACQGRLSQNDAPAQVGAPSFPPGGRFIRNSAYRTLGQAHRAS